MKKILFLLAVSLVAFQLTCFASISVTGSTGIIKITPPGGGTPITIQAGQPIPAIADGSSIEIVSGNLTVTTTAPSTIDLTVEGNSISLPSDSTVQVSLNTNGAIKVFDSNGVSTVKTLDGKTTSLKQGNTIIIAGKTVKNAEPYTPPTVNNLGQINTNVGAEESSAEISPVR